MLYIYFRWTTINMPWLTYNSHWHLQNIFNIFQPCADDLSVCACVCGAIVCSWGHRLLLMDNRHSPACVPSLLLLQHQLPCCPSSGDLWAPWFPPLSPSAFTSASRCPLHSATRKTSQVSSVDLRELIVSDSSMHVYMYNSFLYHNVVYSSYWVRLVNNIRFTVSSYRTSSTPKCYWTCTCTVCRI